ncbi:MAG: UvrD-helicase domain-containing protein [Planctomycetes bacterium]|nr:UvrD-helicase domain-containing protein [Planctomycetota bacterium]
MSRRGEFPNEEQRAIVEATGGARLILAPAGTGKTLVMAARLAQAVLEGVAPERALCVTFTNRAAAEMRARVAERLPREAQRVHVRTFHGLCAWMLRRDAPLLGLPRDFVVYDDQDSGELLERILAELPGKLRAERPADFYQRLSSRKSNASGDELALLRIPPLFLGSGEEAERRAAQRYHLILAERHALDFADLVYRVRALLCLDAGARDFWAARFDWVQVDEVQDTHHSEYEVIRALALCHRNLALFGDVDQTIYEWRGSNPAAVIGRFRAEFDPVRQHFLALNHRSTKRLLAAADCFAATFAERKTRLVPHPDLEEGEPIVRHQARTAADEAHWVAAQAARLRRAAPASRVGILARTHRRLACLSQALAAARVPHVTVEQFEFFRRQEIKDAVARLRLVLNPHDSGALRRILVRPPSRLGEKALAELYEQGAPAGLRLTDLALMETHEQGEPFAALLAALEREQVVVLDVETTGLSPAEDEVVEIAARRVGREGVGAAFHRLLRPARPVGDSLAIHGWSDEFLAANGADPAVALREFAAFVGGCHLAGHNLRFDLAMLGHHGARLGVALEQRPCSDTLDVARRLVNADRYDLATLCRVLGLDARPEHRAQADADAAAALLLALEPALRENGARRAALVAKHGRRFLQIARSLGEWRDAARATRPALLLERVLEESGLQAFYRPSPGRLAHLEELVALFRRRDAEALHPWTALQELTQYAALARNVDHLPEDDPRIPVVTVHQAKGLEFDAVFVAGLCEGEFPSLLAEREGRLEEERRLFYVALTRARSRLFLSGHEENDQGRRRGMSRFFAV